MDEPTAVLVTGIYGTGKTAVIEEMAALLEADNVPYAAIDLDWLSWANVDDAHGGAGHRLMLENLGAVIDTYREAGMTRYLLAGSFGDAGEVEDVQATIEMPLRVVRLTAPIDVIERRLASDPTTGRRDDLEQARQDYAAAWGASIGDLVVHNDRPIREVANEILDWLGWR